LRMIRARNPVRPLSIYQTRPPGATPGIRTFVDASSSPAVRRATRYHRRCPSRIGIASSRLKSIFASP
jgi:hypothetical protein